MATISCQKQCCPTLSCCVACIFLCACFKQQSHAFNVSILWCILQRSRAKCISRVGTSRTLKQVLKGLPVIAAGCIDQFVVFKLRWQKIQYNQLNLHWLWGQNHSALNFGPIFGPKPLSKSGDANLSCQRSFYFFRSFPFIVIYYRRCLSWQCRVDWTHWF